MITERDPMTLNESSVPALGGEERSDEAPRAGRARPKPITDSGVKPITQSGQADHLSERSDAGVRLCRSVIGLGQ